MTQLGQGIADPESIVALLPVSLRLFQKFQDSLTVRLDKSGVFDGETILP